MFGMSFTEIVLILAIALVVLGPDRLPGVARALGKALREFRRATREIRTSLEVDEIRRSIRERTDEGGLGATGKPFTDRSGKPIAEAPDDLADEKARLRESSPHRPSLIKKPKRPPVATTGPSVSPKPPKTETHSAGEPVLDEPTAAPAEEPIEAALDDGVATRDDDPEASEVPVERTSSKRESKV